MTTNQSKSTLKWIDYSDDSQQSEQEKEEATKIPSLKQQTISKQEIRQSDNREPQMRKVRSEYQSRPNSQLSVEESKKKIEQWEQQQIWLFVQQAGHFKECLYTAMNNDPNKKIKVYKSKFHQGHDLLVPTELAKNLLIKDISAIVDFLKKLGEQVIIPNFSEQQFKSAKQAKIVIHQRNFKKRERRDRQPYQNKGKRNYNNNRNRQQGEQGGYERNDRNERRGKNRYQNNGDYQQKRNGNGYGDGDGNGRRQGDEKKKTYVNKQTGEAPQNKKNLIKKTISEQQRKYTKKQAAIRGQELAFFRNRAPEQAVVDHQQQRKQKIINQQGTSSKKQAPIKQQKEPYVRKQARQDQVYENTKKRSYKSKQQVQISLGTKKSTAEEVPKVEKPNERNYNNRNYENDREQRKYQVDREVPNERNYNNDRSNQNEEVKQLKQPQEKNSKAEIFSKQSNQKKNYKEKDSNYYKPKNTKKQPNEDDKPDQKKPQKPKNQNRFAAMMSDDSDN